MTWTSSETNFSIKVDRYLKNTYGKEIWFLNVYGNAVQRSGVPDRLICFKGKFIALEFKREDGKGTLSKQQEIEIKKIQRSGGIAVSINNLDDVKQLFNELCCK